MKLRISVNFDFGKLANKIPDLISGYMDEFKEESASASRAFIKSGSVTPGIEDSTKARRKRRGNPPLPPLYETGALHDSIQSVQNGIELYKYGSYHQFGRGQKKRPFISIFSKKAMGKFMTSVKKSLHLDTPLVSK